MRAKNRGTATIQNAKYGGIVAAKILKINVTAKSLKSTLFFRCNTH
jgi:hypothetical protein